MSGIAAIMQLDGRPVDRELLESMSAGLTIRGSDSCNTIHLGHIGLAHRLLQTDDERPTVQQPLTIDGEVWIVADARIDAQDDLIARLKSKGRDVNRRATDAELILHAFHAWGSECVNHMLGDFTFVVANPRQSCLFAARDHLGVKPLYYAVVDECAIVSNSLDCVRTHYAVRSDLCDAFICDFLLFGWNTNNEATAFRDICRLAPAHAAEITCDGLRTRRYWSVPIPDERGHRPFGEYVEGFREVFGKSVGDRLRNRRMAITMSGGIDSTALAATALPILKELSSDASLDAVCVVYDRIMPDQERRYASLTAQHLGIPIHFIVADDLPFIDAAWDTCDTQTPEPSVRFPGPRSIVKTLADAHFRVVLSGEGGDEAIKPARLYYPRLLRDRRFGRWLADSLRHVAVLHRLPPIGLRTAFFKRPWEWMRGKQTKLRPRFPNWIDLDMVRALSLVEHWNWFWDFGRDIRSDIPGGHAALNSFMLPSCLNWHEINAMEGGYEERFPFLDLRVLDYCWSLPPIPYRFEKELVRRAMNHRLPDPVRLRRKQGLPGSNIHMRDDGFGLTWSDFTDRTPILGRYVSENPLSGNHRATQDFPIATHRTYELASWLYHRHSASVSKLSNLRGTHL